MRTINYPDNPYDGQVHPDTTLYFWDATAQTWRILPLAGGVTDYEELSNLPELGNSASRNVGTIAGTVAAGDDPRITGTPAAIENALADHESASNPHPGYLTPAEGNAAYKPIDEIPNRLLLDNGSKVEIGSFDAGTGGLGGISQVCAAGIELNWQAGRLRAFSEDDTLGTPLPINLDSPLVLPAGGITFYDDTTLTTAPVTNLGYTPATRLLSSSSGSDVTLPLADGTSAGLLSEAGFTKLASVEERSNHSGTQDVSTITGLGDAAVLDVGTTAGSVAAGDDPRITNALPSDPAGITGATRVVNLVKITGAAYDALVTKNSNTVYIVSRS